MSLFRWGTNISYNSVIGAMKGSEGNTFSGTVTLSYSVKNVLFKNQTSIDINKGKKVNMEHSLIMPNESVLPDKR